ncbi:hypothetical protein CWB96_06360 [Pseudoalteromonas citrea]|uniref:Pvc16 N-terminal domain-containing protein n=1 Tax=Pseudoalteromonas citrea TaxID=43655 RepID=A0A5S3XRQ2_9GAMM|nr:MULTISPECIES: Pvc16 family protein [Pseudoalteromonas]RJE76977.1 hypothetical protein BGP78_01645 [Pseudoalteromonas sp. MSK9-3]TMP41809.1 hypothetical protein CWB97_13670 [Pseudoalteromonas citrea]TMP60586.1 hypothetical protein CWB96_06360 [Pseudoalteromonas citrea]
MDPTLVFKLQKALKTFINERILALTDGQVDQDVQLSFRVPDKSFFDKVVNNVPTVNCYLIGVGEDINRRQSEIPRMQVNDTQTGSIYYKEPKFVTLTYMLTAWSKDDEKSAEVEHLILSYLLCGLGRYDFLPSEILNAHNIQLNPYGIRAQLFGNEQSDKVSGQVWQALGSSPKPTLLYSLSLPIPVFEPIELPIVREINNLLDQQS